MRAEVEQSLIRVGLGGTPDTLVAEFRFDPALPVFRGHFPGRPLVPAAFEVEMVRLAAERLTGRRWRIARIRAGKFTGPIAPGDSIVVSAVLARGDGTLGVKATLAVDAAVKAKLAMTLERPGAGA